MNNVSFKSTIRPVGHWEFHRLTNGIQVNQHVKYPWTIKESVLSNKALTKDVYDCTVCGITDGLKVLMMHICPTRSENNDFSKIIDYIKKNINLANENLQGFLFGSRKTSPGNQSKEIFENFETFLQECKIPYSKIKGSSHYSDIAYISEIDEWIIKHEKMGCAGVRDECRTAERFFKEYFDEVKISELDETIW